MESRGNDSTIPHNPGYSAEGTFDGTNGKRLRDSSWEGSIKRTRRDDQQFTPNSAIYDHNASGQYFTQPLAAPTAYPPRNNSSPFLDSGQYKSPDAVFGAQQYTSNWPGTTQNDGLRLNLAYQQPEDQSQYYCLPNQYGSTPAGFSAPMQGFNEWSEPALPYNGRIGSWDAQIDEPTVYGQDASLHLKLQSISMLDNLSNQIIVHLSKSSLGEIMMLTAGRDYEESQAYFTRRTLFDQTRKVYTRNSVFIDLDRIHHFTASQQETLRKANRATFISSVLEGQDISFFDLDQRFLDAFVSTGQHLLGWQGTIFLELKTQAYIAALMNGDGLPEALLNELFTDDMADRMIARHPDTPNLYPSEQEFLARAKARKQYLYDEPEFQALASLPKKYAWHDFLEEFSSCIYKNMDTIINNPARTPASNPTYPSPRAFGRMSASPALRLQSYGSPFTPLQPTQIPRSHASAPNLSNLASDMAPDESPAVQHTPIQPSTAFDDDMSRMPTSATPDVGNTSTVSKDKTRTPKPAKSGSSGSTQRQPWKPEEEDALLAGLTEVKGPHWSQILSLYGKGGSISDVLKDRNQIQLKDKARNLKLWYLKMGNEVPICLRGVTGELRKRGGARVKAALGLTDDVPSESSTRKSRAKSSTGTPLRNVRSQPRNVDTSSPQIDPALEG